MISSFVRALISAFKARRELALDAEHKRRLVVQASRAGHERTTKSCRHGAGRPEINQVRCARMNRRHNPPKTIVKPTALGPVANTDTKLLIYGLFQKGRVLAQDGIDARKAYDELVAKWTPLAPAVVRSLEEAGNQLLTFYEFPRAMWKSIRTTNALENLNREFRRRTKTQASFSSEESAVALLFGLIASGQIQLRRIDGYQRLSEVLEHAEVAA